MLKIENFSIEYHVYMYTYISDDDDDYEVRNTIGLSAQYLISSLLFENLILSLGNMIHVFHGIFVPPHLDTLPLSHFQFASKG